MLNALRHQRKEHCRQSTTGCSGNSCAQRLTASTEGTHPTTLLSPSAWYRCSTPYGINGRNTGKWAANPECDFCAQRLTASTEGTQVRESGGALPEVVLNALRHQRKEHAVRARLLLLAGRVECSTPYGINGRNTWYFRTGTLNRDEVLNALRHQRKEHPLGSSAKLLVPLCSTPYGINGRNTTWLPTFVPRGWSAQRLTASTEGTRQTASQRGPSRAVLNALRHQRKEHRLPLLVAESVYGCSTPYGINGRNTQGRRGVPSPPACAQRLTASTEGTPQVARDGVARLVMCSTPYGINGRNTMIY